MGLDSGPIPELEYFHARIGVLVIGEDFLEFGVRVVDGHVGDDDRARMFVQDVESVIDV
ncbi:hypothetical protein [Nocardia ignorata]|uniref:hypothetical protein n=1 Tax=Nocardia ignorata TaxID=145285 RepID=UPI0012ED0CF2|nr:hypothetical protein [Nocardia ignorata]